MRKLALLIFQSVDGVMQAPSQPDEDVSGGFELGGWANPCWGDVMEQVTQEAMAESYDLLLGGYTYDLFAPHFSQAGDDNPVAAKLNQAKKYVATSRAEPLDWNNSTQLTGDLAQQIAELKQADGPLIQVHGSWQLVQLLLQAKLVDELRVWTFPVALGSGKRLFEQLNAPVELQLSKTAQTPSGAVMTFYQTKY
ncbi:dihydrofolate reductase family protein [Pleionea sp. CnH1-48]|uniref:dihydrofolate reductase family protein n=1 Tax=Pleionea sp. CnH1-48 TaxID=2954494 RepID=UPI002097E7DD|nr:dihydrofolate reductase family protein [Pleionea sp. CnH1-48]MCO7226972.1 dihydrofolate reductase family protein [Pleionea sp. CnH1-48]